MNTTGLVKYTGGLLALAICSACGGGSAVAPSNAALTGTYVGRTLVINGRPVTAARLGGSVLPRFETIVPDVLPGRKHEYINNYYGTYASAFDYPKSNAQIGSINNVGGQGCTNVLHGYGKNTFWIVAGPDQISEYGTRGDKLIKTLSVSYVFPSSCAMDASGDLAVGILYGNSNGSGGGEVVIFKNATGTGTVYTTPLDEEFFDGYDNQGNLFADGFTGDRSGFALVELPKGSSTFRTITTSNVVNFPGSVQWDGTYLTVVDQTARALYQYTVTGTTATLKNTVSLTGAGDCAQTWIVKGLLYCADAGTDGAEVFKYPAGGSIAATFSGEFDEPLGTVAAEKR